MSFARKRNRGFSLFTPLVGTTMVILAILAASMMAENDLRTSRALAGSSITSTDYINIKVVKANVEAETQNAVKARVMEIEESPLEGKSDILGALEARVSKEISLMTSEAVVNAVDATRKTFVFKGSEPETPDDTEISNAIHSVSKDLFKEEHPDGRVCITLDSSQFDDIRKDVWMKIPTPDGYEKIGVLPENDITVCTPDPVRAWAEWAEGIREELGGGLEGKHCPSGPNGLSELKVTAHAVKKFAGFTWVTDESGVYVPKPEHHDIVWYEMEAFFKKHGGEEFKITGWKDKVTLTALDTELGKTTSTYYCDESGSLVKSST